MDETNAMGVGIAERLLRGQQLPRSKSGRQRRWRRRLDVMVEVPAAALNLSRRGGGLEGEPRKPAAARQGATSRLPVR